MDQVHHKDHDNIVLDTTHFNNLSGTSVKINLINIIKEEGSIDCFRALFGRFPNTTELESLNQIQKEFKRRS